MARTDILFSPVGFTDPVRDDFDGPLLHILRHYRPRKAYIVLTRETAEVERKDHRYTDFARRVSPDTELETVDTDIADASDFELYFPVYEKLLDGIAAQHAGNRILINMSSGTPQGIATLCAYLCSRAPGQFLGVQVKTPEEASNRDKKHYNPAEPIDRVFESLLDEHADLYRSIFGGDEAPCRCRELKLHNYTRSYLISRLQASISSGDFTHCAALAEDGQEYLSDAFVNAAKGAMLRQRYQIDEARKRFSAAGCDGIIPQLRCSAALEFYLGIRHAFQRGDYAAFYARLSPLALAMAKEALEKGFGLPIKSYIDRQERSGMEALKIERIRRDRPDIVSDAERRLGFSLAERDNFVKLIVLNAFMAVILERSGDPTQKELVEEFMWVREQEMKLRNFIDHNMGCLTEQDIRSCSGMKSPYEVLRRMDRLFIRVYQLDRSNGFKPSLLDEYQRMNEVLRNLIEVEVK